ncbi:MAG: 3'-5' exonuclease [Gammaproteobacteria bacterium]|nr:3'-5' exonuclease [Gammaproteobacteria bacterium]
MNLASLLPLEWRRQRALRRAPAGPLHEYLQHPFPDRNQDYRQARYLAIDLETSGLDPKRDHILSIGCVEISANAIELGSARHIIVSSDQTLSEDSVVIHRLTDDVIAEGESVAAALTDLLRQLAGKVLLAHHATMDVGFLRRACQRVFAGNLLVPVVDTLALAQQQSARRNEIVGGGGLRLGALRERYHLPRYQAHNALSDAVAAAELFLAQAAERAGDEPHYALKRLLLKS